MSDVKVSHPTGAVVGRVLPDSAGPEWEQPLIAAVIAAGLSADAPCSCGLPLADHDGPLTRGEGPYRDVWYGSRECWGGPGVPGSAEALIATYGTTDPEFLRSRFALPDTVAAAEELSRARQVAA
jgi:hypothetical protein